MTDRSQAIAALSPERRRLLARWLRQRGEEFATHPLTPAQERLWFLERLDPGRALYTMPAAVHLRGALDRSALAASLVSLMERHEVLRSTFADVDGRPVQAVGRAPAADGEITTVDLSRLADPLGSGRALASALARKPFDLSRGPLLRTVLMRLGVDDHLLTLVLHHLVADGRSLAVIVSEIASEYAAATEGSGAWPPRPPLQYSDYARWLVRLQDSPAFAEDLAWWRECLAGELPTLAPLADRPAPLARSHRGGTVPVHLPGAVVDRLDEVARQCGASPFVVLLAAFVATLYRLTGEDDLPVGTPVANRPRPELDGLVGLFVNTLVLRVRVDGSGSIIDLVERCRSVVADALRHAEVPFERLVEELRPQRRLGTNPLFQVMLAFQEEPPPAPVLPRLAVDLEPVDAGRAKVDLTLDLERRRRAGGNGRAEVEGGLEIDLDLYDRPTGERWIACWRVLLDGLLTAPETPVDHLPLLSERERRQVEDHAAGGLAHLMLPNDDPVWAAASDSGAPPWDLPAAWRIQAREAPDAPAVETLSYGELARRGALLARVLASHVEECRAAVGAGRLDEPRVAILIGGTEPSELAVALWGVLSSGCTYVPIDPELPPARATALLRASGAVLALTTDELLPWVAGLPGMEGSAAPRSVTTLAASVADPAPPTKATSAPGPESAAYLLFTSGSTGEPKGVVVPHRAVAHHARVTAAAFQLVREDRVLQMASPGFDVSVEELFPTWLAGAGVVSPLSSSAVPPAELSALIERRRVTVVNLPGSYWHEWVAHLEREAEDRRALFPTSLRLVVVGSEPVSAAAAAAWRRLGGPELLSAYGLTEATVTSTLHRVGTLDGARLSIGRPLPGVEARVLDRAGNPLPAGAPGALHLGGVTLVRGYAGRPGATAAAFGPDPFARAPGSRLLNTGDRVRRRPDGNLDVLGRLDEQLKVRGVRIEPREVEVALAAHPNVADAAVVAVGEGRQRRLVAWWTPAEAIAGASSAGEPGDSVEAELRAHLAARLPRPMVPSRVVGCTALPRSMSGKVDKRALERDAAREERTVATSAPGGPFAGYDSPTQEMVARTFEDTLGVTGIGPEDDFFALGGHSLLATQVLAQLEEALGVRYSLRDLFESSTVAGLAGLTRDRAIEDGEATGPPPAAELPAEDASSPAPLSPTQERFWVLERMAPGSARYTIPAALDLWGSLAPIDLARSLGILVERHGVLRSAFRLGLEGPVQEVRPFPARSFPLPLVDLSGLGEEIRERALGGTTAQLARRGFDLERPPLLAAALLRVADGEGPATSGPTQHRLVLSVHHIAADGWSFGVLVRELSRAYRALTAGRRVGEGDRSPLQFVQYARWQRRWLAGEVGERQLEHWRRRLGPLLTDGAAPAFELPGDRPRPAVESLRGTSRVAVYDSRLVGGLEALIRTEGATLYMGLVALFATLLGRWTGQRLGVLGTPVANRERPEIRNLVGPALNLLALPVDLGTAGTVAGLLRLLRRELLEDFQCRDLPFERLVEELDLTRDLSRAPLFQVLLTLQNAPLPPLDLPGVEASLAPADSGAARYDLAVSFERRTDGDLEATFEYNPDLYEASTVARLARSLGVLWESAVATPARRLDSLPLLATGERHQLLHEWSGRPGGVLPAGRRPYRPRSIHRQIAAQAVRAPHASALTLEDPASGEVVVWTYGGLVARVGRVAAALREAGLGPGAVVGLACERSEALVTGMLAVLEVGAAYLPLDPGHPVARLQRIVDDAEPALVLVGSGTGGESAIRFAGRPALSITRLLEWDPAGETRSLAVQDSPGESPDALAYVIYTSGSTGSPKGVAATHRNAAAFFDAMDRVLGRGGGEPERPIIFLAATSLSFDISVLELLWTLARGFQVVLQTASGAEGALSGVEPAAVARTAAPGPVGTTRGTDVDLSLFYFADDASAGVGSKRYRLLLDGARLADRHGFSAVWTPERHFHSFGGLYPNPSVMGSALASVTERIGIRAGSVVAPLHHPVRIAEEWSVVDNLSDGRVGISFASGWHTRDFTLAPGSFDGRKKTMLETLETVRRLWRGEEVLLPDGRGEPVPVSIHPRPVQPELPVWLTAAGSPETFRRAGALGAFLLTHVLSQTEDELAQKITLYRRAWRDAGHPGEGHVTLMLHTFVGPDEETVRATVRSPLTAYLESSLDLLRGPADELGIDVDELTPADRDLLLEAAFERYYAASGLFGTPSACGETLERLHGLGVDEMGCLIDFGVPVGEALEGLEHLARLGERVRSARASAPVRPSLRRPYRTGRSTGELVRRHRVTHLQCTPSLVRLLAADPATGSTLAELEGLLVGGEVLPPELAQRLQRLTAIHGTQLFNLYGPTETTVWSAVHALERPVETVGPSASISIGRPLAGERILVVDRCLRPTPPSTTGELAIGGAGVTQGYRRRPAETARAFVPDPLESRPGERLYRTGDLARVRSDGRLEISGRWDQQAKVGGHRIELGEVEAALCEHPGVAAAAVLATDGSELAGAAQDGASPGARPDAAATRLVAWVSAVSAETPPGPALPLAVTPTRREEILSGLRRFRLPNGMVVAHLGDLHTRVGYEEIFENDSYFRHGIGLEDGAVVLDVGANIGFFTLAVHALCRPGRVYAFEPIPPTYDALVANVALYGLDSVRPVNAGLGTEAEEVEFTFYPGMDGLSGRYADEAADRQATRAIILDRLREEGLSESLAGEEVEAFLDRQFTAERPRCRVLPLSAVIRKEGIERIDLLKVDVERAEVDVLRGLADEDWPRVRQVVLEVDTRENLRAVEELLETQGFDVLTEDLVSVEGQNGEPGVEVFMVYAARDGLSPSMPVRTRVPRRPSAPPALPSPAALREHVAERLPGFMVPASIHRLDALPLTPNGKVDRKALLARLQTIEGDPRGRRGELGGSMPPVRDSSRASSMPARTEAEQAVVEIWSRLLSVEDIGLHDNFFEVGGNSLLLARVHGELAERFGRPVPMLELFRKPTVASLAAYLAAEDATVVNGPGPSEASPGEAAVERARQRAGRATSGRGRTASLDRQREFSSRRRDGRRDADARR